MFASNFPVDKASCSFAVLCNAYKRLTAHLSPAVRQEVFSAWEPAPGTHLCSPRWLCHGMRAVLRTEENTYTTSQMAGMLFFTGCVTAFPPHNEF